MGLGLEKFDGAGQFRTHENGEAIDASSEFNKVKFDGAAALGALLAQDPRVTSCLVQSTYRYATGRALGSGEEGVVAGLEQDFIANGRRIPDLMRAIATDPAFYLVRSERAGVRRAARPHPEARS
jgi:hypothetical protein